MLSCPLSLSLGLLVESGVGISKSTGAGAFQSKVSETMLPPMAVCWESLAGGVRVGGLWCRLIMTR